MLLQVVQVCLHLYGNFFQAHYTTLWAKTQHNESSNEMRGMCLAQGEGVSSGLGVKVSVKVAGPAVDDAVGVGFVVGVGVGGGGSGMGIIKKTMLRTTIRLRIQKAIWRDLTCDLREPRFTAYLLGGWRPFCNPSPLL